MGWKCSEGKRDKNMESIKNIVKGAKNYLFGKQSTGNAVSNGRDFKEVGFHGDQYLLALVDRLTDDCEWFVETGTNVGSTLAYVARTYPGVECLSCEPDPEAFERAQKNTSSFSNATVFPETSQAFMERLETEYSHLFSENALFWVDAHGFGFEWPLREEVSFISSHFERGYMLIDDFRVPRHEEFGYDNYEGQECTMRYIEDVIDEGWDYQLYYPDYTEHTSSHHPLRGWGLFVFGEAQKDFPDEVADFVYESG